jgi:hypothetical protein
VLKKAIGGAATPELCKIKEVSDLLGFQPFVCAPFGYATDAPIRVFADAKLPPGRVLMDIGAVALHVDIAPLLSALCAERIEGLAVPQQAARPPLRLAGAVRD